MLRVPTVGSLLGTFGKDVFRISERASRERSDYTHSGGKGKSLRVRVKVCLGNVRLSVYCRFVGTSIFRIFEM